MNELTKEDYLIPLITISGVLKQIIRSVGQYLARVLWNGLIYLIMQSRECKEQTRGIIKIAVSTHASVLGPLRELELLLPMKYFVKALFSELHAIAGLIIYAQSSMREL